MREEELRQMKEEIRLPPQMAESLVQNCMEDGRGRAGRGHFLYSRYARMCCVLLPVFILISIGSTSLAAYEIYQERQLTVFMESSLTAEEIDAIGEELRKNPAVTSCQFVSGEQAWEEFKDRYFEENEELAEGFTDNPLADSFNYRIKVRFNSNVTKVRQQILQIDGVRRVSTIRDLNTPKDFTA